MPAGLHGKVSLFRNVTPDFLFAAKFLCHSLQHEKTLAGNLGSLGSHTHLCCFMFHCHFPFEYLMPLGNMVILSFCDVFCVLDGVAGFLFLSSFTTSRLDPENTLYILITEEE